MNTKKLLLHAAVLATMLTSISCSQEEVAGGQAGDESVVTFTAQLPGSPQSKAIGDGMTANTLSYAVYAQGTTTPLITSEDEVKFTNGQATISLRLASGKSYDFLFWADAYDSEDVNVPYTVDFNTQTLTIDYDAAKTLSNDERRDAFFGTTTLEVKGAVNGNVTLKRPFAQLNIGTNDMEDAANTGLNTRALKTSVRVKNVYKNLNLMNGEVGKVEEAVTVTFEENNIPKGQFTANGNTYDYLALNYLLVGTDKGVVDCKFTYTDGATNDSKTISKTISNVPVQRNYRTNIFGSILTGAVDLGITIDPDFDTYDHNYEELLLAAQNGGSVTLTENITITDEAPIVIDNGNTLTVDLNGKTITRTGEDNGSNGVWAFRVNNGTLILNDATGTGTINGGEGLEHSMLWANGANAKIIINSGNYTVGGNPNGNNYNVCVYASNSGSVEIYGGTFENKAAQTGSANLYPALNVSNGSPGTITVYGGTFKNYDPATGDDNRGGSFVATDYSSVKVSDAPTPNGTYQVVRGIGIANLTDLQNALATLASEGGELTIVESADIDISALNAALKINHPTTITIDGTITSTNESVQLRNNSELTIQGNGTVSMARRVVENYGTLTVNGGTFSTSVNNGGTAFWNNSEDAVMTLNNVNVNASFFAVAGSGEININGGNISSTSSNKYGSWAYCIRAQEGATMVIKDATIKGVQGCIASIEGSYLTVENVDVQARNSDESHQDAFYALYAASEGIIEVISGKFYSDRTPCCLASNDDNPANPLGEFVLKGGRYSSTPQVLQNRVYEDWTPATGYQYADTEDETYPVEIVAEP